jgi:large subunit ribosomal protein L4
VASDIEAGEKQMPSVPLVDIASSTRSERMLNDDVFGVRPNHHLIYEAVRQFRAGRRRGTHATKSRALVSGGGKKPWRQKGTGRARVGSIRTPLWKGGGTVFGPHPRDHSFRLNGKVQRGALRSALSLRAEAGEMTVVAAFPLEVPSTKAFREQLDSLGLSEKILVVDVKPPRELVLSARNLPGVEIRSVAALSTYDVLAARHVVLSEEAVARLEEKLGK